MPSLEKSNTPRNIFDEEKIHKTISLNLYCDEITDTCAENENWFYVGVLLVPTDKEKELLKNIKNCYGESNTQVEYKSTGNGEKFGIAKEMINYVMNDQEMIYFYILGINLSRIDKKKFGDKKKFEDFYNRFFRTAVLKSAKSYFNKYKKIFVENIYHDKGGFENHEYFPWHSIYRISKDPQKKISVKNKEIVFIDSDHRKSNDNKSRFIQLIDVIMGVACNVILHGNSEDKNKIALANELFPLVDRLIEKPKNKNSRYKYFNRMSIEFFPKEKTKLDREFNKNIPDDWDLIKKIQNSFYHKRELSYRPKESKTRLHENPRLPGL